MNKAKSVFLLRQRGTKKHHKVSVSLHHLLMSNSTTKIGGFTFKKNTTNASTTNSTASKASASSSSTSNSKLPLSATTTNASSSPQQQQPQQTGFATTSNNLRQSLFQTVTNPQQTPVPYWNSSTTTTTKTTSWQNRRCGICDDTWSHESGPDCPLYRTLLCKDWASADGVCSKRDQCWYAHPTKTFSSERDAHDAWSAVMRRNLSYGRALTTSAPSASAPPLPNAPPPWIVPSDSPRAAYGRLKYSGVERTIFESLGVDWKEVSDGSWESHVQAVRFQKTVVANVFYRNPGVYALACANDGDCLSEVLEGHSCIVSGIPLDKFTKFPTMTHFRDDDTKVIGDKSVNANEVYIRLTALLLEKFPSLLYFTISSSVVGSESISVEPRSIRHGRYVDAKTSQQHYTFATVIVKDKSDFEKHASAPYVPFHDNDNNNHQNNNNRFRNFKNTPASAVSSKTSRPQHQQREGGYGRLFLKLPDPTVTTAMKESYLLPYRFTRDVDTAVPAETSSLPPTTPPPPTQAESSNLNNNNNRNRRNNNNKGNNQSQLLGAPPQYQPSQQETSSSAYSNNNKQTLFSNISLLYKILSFFDKTQSSKHDLVNFATVSKTFLETFISYRASYLMERTERPRSSIVLTDSTFIPVLRMARVLSADHLQLFLGTLEGLVGIPPKEFLRAALKSSSPYIFTQVFRKFLPQIESPLAVASDLSRFDMIDETAAPKTLREWAHDTLYKHTAEVRLRNDNSNILYLRQILTLTKPIIGWAKTVLRKKNNSKNNQDDDDQNDGEQQEQTQQQPVGPSKEKYSADEIDFVMVDPISGEEQPTLKAETLKQILKNYSSRTPTNHSENDNDNAEGAKNEKTNDNNESLNYSIIFDGRQSRLLSGTISSGTIQPTTLNFPSPKRDFFLNSHYLVVLFYHPRFQEQEQEDSNNNESFKNLNDYFVCADAFLPISSLLHYRLNVGLFLWYQNLLQEDSGRELPSKFEIWERSRCISREPNHDVFSCGDLHRQETQLTKMIEVFEMEKCEELSKEVLKSVLGENMSVKVIKNDPNGKGGKRKKKH